MHWNWKTVCMKGILKSYLLSFHKVRRQLRSLESQSKEQARRCQSRYPLQRDYDRCKVHWARLTDDRPYTGGTDQAWLLAGASAVSDCAAIGEYWECASHGCRKSYRGLLKFTKAGFTPMEVIVCATENGARTVQWAKALGTLETGKIADL